MLITRFLIDNDANSRRLRHSCRSLLLMTALVAFVLFYAFTVFRQAAALFLANQRQSVAHWQYELLLAFVCSLLVVEATYAKRLLVVVVGCVGDVSVP